jgi:hypothetical protein
MIASTLNVARPLVVKQTTLQPKRQRNVVMAMSQKQEEACPPAVDRRRCVGDFVIFHLLLLKLCFNKPKPQYKLTPRFGISNPAACSL